MIRFATSWILEAFWAIAPERQGCILGTVVFRGKEQVFLGVIFPNFRKFLEIFLRARSGARVPTPANYTISPPRPWLCPSGLWLCPVRHPLCPIRLSLCPLGPSLCPESITALSTAPNAHSESPIALSPSPNRSRFRFYLLSIWRRITPFFRRGFRFPRCQGVRVAWCQTILKGDRHTCQSYQ